MIPWNLITFLGDSVVTLPAAAAVLVWLASARAWRLSIAWSVLFGGAMFLVLATKVAFIGWGIGIASLDFTGISGHAARACAVFPVIAYLLLKSAAERRRFIGVLGGCLLAGLVAVSRVILHYHSSSEVVSGILVGSMVAIGLIQLSERGPGLSLRRWAIALTLVCLMPTTYAEPAPSQHWVTALALYLSGNDRPYVRGDSGRLARTNAPAVEY